jgi:hypothetical protein
MDRAEELTSRIISDNEVNWDIVQQIVEEFTRRHPDVIAGCIDYVEELRKSKTNQYALEKGSQSNRRHIMEIPSSLLKGLSLKYPTLFTGENQRKFLKLYPIFQVAEKL